MADSSPVNIIFVLFRLQKELMSLMVCIIYVVLMFFLGVGKYYVGAVGQK